MVWNETTTLWYCDQVMFTLQLSIPFSVHCLLCLAGWCQSIRAPHLSRCSREALRCHSMENLKGQNKDNLYILWTRSLRNWPLNLKQMKTFDIVCEQKKKQSISFYDLNPADTVIMFHHNPRPHIHTVLTQTGTCAPAKLIREQRKIHKTGRLPTGRIFSRKVN